MKEIIEEILFEFQKEDLPAIINRDTPMPVIPKPVRKALVFVGMRRVGKTFLMYQHMQNAIAHGLEKEKLFYINFEDDRLGNFAQQDFQTLLDIYFERYPMFMHADDLIFYFDEIQNIDGWEKFIRRLLDKEHMSIFITGSSAKLLSREIATSLRGRSLEQEVFPLSLVEYIHYQGVRHTNRLNSKEKAVIKHHTKNYLRYGGFPETLGLSDSLHQQMIQSYVNAAVFRDVIERHQLKNTHIVKAFLVHCLQNIASPLSITKVFRTFKTRGEVLSRNSLYEYLSHFEDAYLICTVPIFELSTRKRQVNPSKIYCVDPGIIYSYSIRPHTEFANCLENAIYIHLRGLDFENIYYYKTNSSREIDFIAQRVNGTIELFQVCHEMNDEKTRCRELTAIHEAAEELNVNEATIVTSDTNETVIVGGITIRMIPYWEWCINTSKPT